MPYPTYPTYPPPGTYPGWSNPFYSGNWNSFQNSPAPTTNNSGPNPIGMPVYNLPNWLVQPTNPGWNWNQLQAMNPQDQALAMNYYQGLLAYINSAAEIQQSERDYLENIRRYNQEWGHTVDQDLWSRTQAEGQLALGNRTQDELTAYRNAQLAQQESEFGRTFGLQQLTQEQLNAYRQAQLAQQEAEFGRTFGLQQLTQEQLNAYRQAQLAQQESEFGRTFGLQQLTQEQLNAYRNAQLAQQESEFGRTFGLQQLTQEQLNAYRNAQLGQQESEFARRLGLDTRTQDELTAYRNRTLDQQEAEFARRLGLDTRTQDDLVQYRTEQLSNERRGQDISLQQSAINTWGRREKPNARWM